MSLSLRSTLHLAAGVAAVLVMTSCEDPIEAYCNTSCAGNGSIVYDDTGTANCVDTLESASHEPSCSDAFTAFFQCEQGPGSTECGTGLTCSDQLAALTTCLYAHDPDNTCACASAHVAACQHSPAELGAPRSICAGIFACQSYCVLQGSCDDLMSDGDAYERCSYACYEATLLGLPTPPEGD